MQISSINELKKELKQTDKSILIEICLKIVKFKVENKEFLNYLLFESNNIDDFLEKLKSEIDEEFQNLNYSNLYLINKQLRKILRKINKYNKFVSDKKFQVEILLYFCTLMNKNRGKIKIHLSNSLSNLYQTQILKIEKTIKGLHEDLQFDFNQELALL